ncbi:hypothetical protein [Solibacillus sp. FSL K6-1554]|uniref:hypothetical protein n=1 Tax=Solibacillus sp. FSL K6-1554 TaxID=2921472 RepID=UPI0030F781EA
MKRIISLLLIIFISFTTFSSPIDRAHAASSSSNCANYSSIDYYQKSIQYLLDNIEMYEDTLSRLKEGGHDASVINLQQKLIDETLEELIPQYYQMIAKRLSCTVGQVELFQNGMQSYLLETAEKTLWKGLSKGDDGEYGSGIEITALLKTISSDIESANLWSKFGNKSGIVAFLNPFENLMAANIEVGTSEDSEAFMRKMFPNASEAVINDGKTALSGMFSYAITNATYSFYTAYHDFIITSGNEIVRQTNEITKEIERAKNEQNSSHFSNREIIERDPILVSKVQNQQKSLEMMNNLLDDMGDLPVTGQLSDNYQENAALINKLLQNDGFNVNFTELIKTKENYYKFPFKSERIEQYHEFKVSFNQPIANIDNLEDYISIRSQYGVEEKIRVEVNGDRTIMTIYLSEERYIPGVEYILIVKGSLTSESSKSLVQPVYINFTAK